MSRESAVLLFWSYFDVSGGPDACHLWTGSIDKGYGQFQAAVLGGKKRVHVLAWELVNGEIPVHEETGRKHDLDHECHNQDVSCPGGEECPHRRCGNLRHLSLKTMQENIDAADEPRKRGKFRTHFDCGCEITTENTYLIERKGTRNGRQRVPERRCKRHERARQQRDRGGVAAPGTRAAASLSCVGCGVFPAHSRPVHERAKQSAA